jgi:hypothetical protein
MKVVQRANMNILPVKMAYHHFTSLILSLSDLPESGFLGRKADRRCTF